jgi:hypothetical protein
MSRSSLGQRLLPLKALRGLWPIQGLQKVLRVFCGELIVISEVAVRRHYDAPWSAAKN